MYHFQHTEDFTISGGVSVFNNNELMEDDQMSILDQTSQLEPQSPMKGWISNASIKIVNNN